MIKAIGKYRIEDEIGHGAFGRVYRAFDPDADRHVAIKVLLSDTDSELLARFQAEGSTTGKLIHKNIVIVYEFGRQDGVPYLAMELLEGQNLADVLNIGRPFSLLEKVEILHQIAEGLQFAHRKGVIHRDVKPGNVMVLPDGSAKIMDFGIARVLDTNSVRKTRQGDVIGTLLYMAPEQLRGGEADRLTDIFAYGGLCYEFLTGEQPFRAAEPGRVIYRITAEDPAPLRDKIPQCPEGLDLLVHRLLHKDRDLRSSSFDEIILDVQPILQQLRQARALEIAPRINESIDRGEIEHAQKLIGEVLGLDPSNVLAQRCREELRIQTERDLLRTRTQAVVGEAQEHLRARRFALAVECLEKAVRSDKSNPELSFLLEEAKARAEKGRQSSRLVSEARWDLSRLNPESAALKLSRAWEIDPGNQEAVALQGLAAVMANSASLSRGGNHAAALELLKEAGAWQAEQPAELVQLRSRIASELAAAELQRNEEEFGRELDRGRSQLGAGESDLARATAAELIARYPEKRAAFDFHTEVLGHLAAQRRVKAVAEIIRNAGESLQEERFAEARAALERGLTSFPAEPGIEHLLELTKTLESASERTQAVSRCVEDAARLASSGELDKALHSLESAILKYGDDAALLEAKRRIELSRILNEGSRLIDREHFDTATEMLRNVAGQFVNEPGVARLLADAQQQKSLKRNSLAQEIERAICTEDWTAADDAIQRARNIVGNDSEIEILVRKLVEQRGESERRRKQEAEVEARNAAQEALARAGKKRSLELFNKALTQLESLHAGPRTDVAIAWLRSEKEAAPRPVRISEVLLATALLLSIGDLEGASLGSRLFEVEFPKEKLLQDLLRDAIGIVVSRQLDFERYRPLKQYEQALREIETLLSQWPSNDELSDHCQSVLRKIGEFKQRQLFDGKSQEIHRLLNARNIDPAIRLFRSLEAEFRGPELEPLNKAVQSALKEQARRSAVAEALSRARILESAGDFESALKTVSEALEQLRDATELKSEIERLKALSHQDPTGRDIPVPVFATQGATSGPVPLKWAFTAIVATSLIAWGVAVTTSPKQVREIPQQITADVEKKIRPEPSAPSVDRKVPPPTTRADPQHLARNSARAPIAPPPAPEVPNVSAFTRPAQSQPSEAPRNEVTPPIGASQLSRDIDGISTALSELAHAFERKDEESLRRVWPSIPGRELDRWRSLFQNARSVRYIIQQKGTPEVEGATARVECQRRVQQVFEGDAQVYSTESTVRLKLNKRDGVWLVESMR